jgi:hypothetical protein
MALAQDAERAVASRLTDIEEMKALFAGAAEAAGGAEPGARRSAFRARQPDSLRISDVDEVHAEGLELLIDLHAWAEVHDPDLNARIWDFLLRHTERHRLDIPGP